MMTKKKKILALELWTQICMHVLCSYHEPIRREPDTLRAHTQHRPALTRIIKYQNKNGAKIETNRFHFAALDRRVVQKGARSQTASVQFVHAWIRNDSQDQLAA